MRPFTKRQRFCFWFYFKKLLKTVRKVGVYLDMKRAFNNPDESTISTFSSFEGQNLMRFDWTVKGHLTKLKGDKHKAMQM